MKMHTHEVFGIRPEVIDASYVDRGSLDEEFKKLLQRKQTHIAIRGASKCGKSWLRQRVLNNPLVIQCRLNYKVEDIYVNALAELGIDLILERSGSTTLKGALKAHGEIGIKILAKAGFDIEGATEGISQQKTRPVGKDVHDLRHIASVLSASGRTLVIEDFHYLSASQQKLFAFDLKTLWDYKTFVVVVGVWISENMLITLNPDLSDRIEEFSVTWTHLDLKAILKKGGHALRLEFTESTAEYISTIAFGSAGLLQKLALRTIDNELGIGERSKLDAIVRLDCPAKISDAAMHVADQLNQLYQAFAKRVCAGIRARKNSTGIYAHAMAAIMACTDDQLINGVEAKEIFKTANTREPRIQFGNLKTVLSRFEELQVDEEGRGLVVAYDEPGEKITIVDRQLLLYRKFATVKWPWEELIEEVSGERDAFGEQLVIQYELPNHR
jgi:hypothetical protein